MDEQQRLLWSAWRERGDPLAKQTLLQRYRKHANFIAAGVLRERGYPADIDLADLEQQAYLALLTVFDRFDPERGVRFESFAKKRIRGSLMDAVAASSELHAQTEWKRKSARERILSLRDSTNGGGALDRLADLAAGLAVGVMLEGTAMFLPGESAREERDPYGDVNDLSVLASKVLEAADRLKDPDASILRAHYREERTFTEIGKMLGLSTARVSQIHARAIRRLRSMLGAPGLDRRY